MDTITAVAKKHNLRLLEDCSHAHGAEFDGQKVGTFGDAAAWSLQGQKTVTGGEGAILLTDDEEIHTSNEMRNVITNVKLPESDDAQ